MYNHVYLREQITSVMLQYKPILILAGVPESSATVLPKKYDSEIIYEYFLDALSFLQKIEKDINELRRIRELMPESAWEMYTLLEHTGLREQEMLEAQAKIVYRAWQRRPILLTRRTTPHGKKVPSKSEIEESDGKSNGETD